MSNYKFVDAKGATIRPADRGAINRAIAGDGLIGLNEAGGVRVKDPDGDIISSWDDSIMSGVYLFQGRQISVYDHISFDLTNAADGAKMGFLYNRAEEETGTVAETILPVLAMPDTEELIDIDLQTSGMIVFGVIGLDEDGKPYLKDDRVKKAKTLHALSDLFMHSEHLKNIAVGKTMAERFVNITAEHGMGVGRYLAICSIVVDQEGAAPYELKLRFANNIDYDYVVKSKETSLQVVAIHDFTFKDAFDGMLAIEAYLYNPNEAITVKDVKIEIFQLY